MKFAVHFGASGRRQSPRPQPPPATAPSFVAPAARQLALAYWVERHIDRGDLRDFAEAARVLGVTRARMTQIANLRLLPVTLQEEVLQPWYHGSERGLRDTVKENPS